MSTLDGESTRTRWNPRVSALIESTCWLGAVVLVTYLVVAFVMFSRVGVTGLVAATAAAAACFASAVAAMWITVRGAGTAGAINASLLSVLVRTGVPLLGVVVSSSVPALAAVGFFGVVMVFYLVTLAAETVLAVRLVNMFANPPKAV